MFPLHKTLLSIQTLDTRCLISTCKIPANLPVQAAAWITALATGATQTNARVFTHLFPPVLSSVACAVRGAEPGRRSGNIPVEGCPVVEARSQRICNLCYTPQTLWLGHNPQS